MMMMMIMITIIIIIVVVVVVVIIPIHYTYLEICIAPLGHNFRGADYSLTANVYTCAAGGRYYGNAL